MIKPKISIVLPIYNVEKYLKIALESLLVQTLKDIEIICVDDCSSDNSYFIALEYEKKDPRIKVIKQPENKGEIVAKFIAAQNAKADYIGTLDPDDYVAPDMYEKLYNKIINSQSDMVICNMRYINENNEFIKDRRICIDTDLDSLPFDKYIINKINPATTNRLIKKDIFLQGLNFQERDVWKDMLQYWRCVTLNECKVSFVDEYLYQYRVRHDSITHSATTEVFEYETFYKTVDLILDYLTKNGCDEGYFDALREKIEIEHKDLLKNSYNIKNYQKLEKKYKIPTGALTTGRYNISPKFINSIINFLNKTSCSEFGLWGVNKIAKILTFGILNKKKRKERRSELFVKYKTCLFGYDVINNAKSIGKGFWCGGFSSVTKNTVLKDYVNFNGMKVMGNGNCTIGSYFHSGIDCLIITQNHNYDKGSMIPYDKTYIYKDVIIEDFVWMGSKVTILPGTKIGEGAIIQAGAVVHGEIPPYAIIGGNPAKIIKYRDVEHFLKLKKEGKFY